MILLFKSRKLPTLMAIFIAINSIAVIRASDDGSGRSIVEETSDGNSVTVAGQPENGDTPHQPDGSGLTNSEITSSPPSTGTDDSTSSEEGYYSTSESSEESSSEEIVQVSRSLLDIQSTVDDLTEANRLTQSSIESQKAEEINKLNELKYQESQLNTTLESSKQTIVEEEERKKQAEANLRIAIENITKLDRVELSILDKLVPVKDRLNQLTSMLKEVQENKATQTTAREENQAKLDQANSTISRQMYDEKTAKVTRTDITSQITETMNRITQMERQEVEQKVKYESAIKSLQSQIMDEISKHGIGHRARCPSTSVQTLTRQVVDDFTPNVDVPPMTVQTDTVMSRVCKQKCTCKQSAVTPDEISNDPAFSPGSTIAGSNSESGYSIYPPSSNANSGSDYSIYPPSYLVQDTA